MQCGDAEYHYRHRHPQQRPLGASQVAQVPEGEGAQLIVAGDIDQQSDGGQHWRIDAGHTQRIWPQRGAERGAYQCHDDQQQRIHLSDDPFIPCRWRQQQAGAGQQTLNAAYRLQVFSGNQHDVGRAGHSAFCRQRLVAFENFAVSSGIGCASIANHRIGGGILAGDHRLRAAIAKDEQYSWFLARAFRALSCDVGKRFLPICCRTAAAVSCRAPPGPARRGRR